MNKNAVLVLLFNVVYITIAIFFVLSKRNIEFLIYTGVVVCAVLIIMRLYHVFQLTVPLLWAFSFWGLAHLAGGLWEVPSGWPVFTGTRVLYNWWIIEGYFKFDQLVHAYGFGISAWLVWQILRSSLALRFNRRKEDIAPTGGILFLCVLGAMGLGALNEIVEFAVMLTVPEANVGDYYNTGWDLVANMTGACIVVFLIYFRRAKG